MVGREAGREAGRVVASSRSTRLELLKFLVVNSAHQLLPSHAPRSAPLLLPGKSGILVLRKPLVALTPLLLLPDLPFPCFCVSQRIQCRSGGLTTRHRVAPSLLHLQLTVRFRVRLRLGLRLRR